MKNRDKDGEKNRITKLLANYFLKQQSGENEKVVFCIHNSTVSDQIGEGYAQFRITFLSTSLP